jgi:L-fucose mutarotase
MEQVDRFDFYDIVRSPDVGLVIATGEERLYANLLLTIGLRSHPNT